MKKTLGKILIGAAFAPWITVGAVFIYMEPLPTLFCLATVGTLVLGVCLYNEK